MLYHFNEGHIAAPPHVFDRTVNLLAPKVGEGGMSIAITRDELSADETPQQFVDRPLVELARQVNKYTKGDQQAAHLGDPGQGIVGVKFNVSYKQQSKTLHHTQALFLLPDTRTILSCTFSLPIEFTAAHHRMVNEVLASFVLRR